MKREELAAAMAAYEQNGGKVEQVEEGKTSDYIDPQLKHCKCGCEGSYTDHRMRMAELGNY